MDWIKRELGSEYVDRAIIVTRPEKLKYATPNALLIDDEIKNYKEFTAAGGKCILHKNTRDTIRQLKKLGL